MQRSGKCLCGAVSFTATIERQRLTACHCSMCRRWTGGPLLCFTADAVDWAGEDHITTFASSEWAERGFCSKCGTSLFYRVTAPGSHSGRLHLGFGALDDPSGFELALEVFIDKKPDAYELAGDRKKMTAAEVFAQFGGS